MSTSSWSTPDPRRTAAVAPAFGAAPEALPAEDSAPLAAEVRAGLVAAVVTVLLGAPVGLLWAATAPRVDVVVVGADVQLVEPGSNAFIAGDGFFLGATLLAGVLGGILAYYLARRCAAGAVAGLALGGLAAAWVAMVVGQHVGFDEVEAAVTSGRQGDLTLNLRLRAREALVAWPVGSLAAFVGAALTAGRRSSSG